jgi:hypothetical protein
MGPQVRDASWGLLGRWFLGTLIGWFVGILLAIGLSYAVVGLFYAEETNLIVGLVLGAAVGLAQLVAVRGVLPLTSRWVWGAAAGLGVPFIVGVVVSEVWFNVTEASDTWLVLVALAGGALAGLLQAPVLRRSTYQARALWWIPASSVSWGVAWLASVAWAEAGIVLGGVVLGAVSGSLLIWMLRSAATHEAV